MCSVSEENIKGPKINVTPPMWVKIIVGLVFILLLIALAYSPIDNVILKLLLIGTFSAVLIGILRKAIKGNYLVTMQANDDGLYFQTDNERRYFHVPWSCIGLMGKNNLSC